jgi:hypothetical protein
MIPYGRQSIDEDDINSVVETLKSDYLTTGPKVKEFEEELAKKLNISVLDISGEYPKEASLAIVYAAHNEKQAGVIRKKIEEFLFKNFPEIEFYFDMEII